MAQDQVQTTNDRINFNLRPAKRIERKMVAEALSVIYRYDTPRRYGYVGMGSYYFSDFVLFHRMFGMDKMISIEVDQTNEKRFEFNKPFDCIEMSWGLTSSKLPTLGIFEERPVICWLDYFDYLTDGIIGDAHTVIQRALPGSAFLVTLKSRSLDNPRKAADFKSNLSENYRKLSDEALLGKGGKGLAEFMTAVLQAAIEPTIVDLNNGRAQKDRIELRQIIKTTYQDGDLMVTIGWLLLTAEQAAKLDAHPIALNAPGVVLSGKTMGEVIAPILTFREIAHLKAMLPNGSQAEDFEEKAGAVPASAARQFARLYRYFPSFADVEE